MKIALDVDGVLADVIKSWLNYSNTIRPKISKHDITDWDFWKKFQINRYDFYAELSSCWKNWNSIPPTEENLSSVTKDLSTFKKVLGLVLLVVASISTVLLVRSCGDETCRVSISAIAKKDVLLKVAPMSNTPPICAV